MVLDKPLASRQRPHGLAETLCRTLMSRPRTVHWLWRALVPRRPAHSAQRRSTCALACTAATPLRHL